MILRPKRPQPAKPTLLEKLLAKPVYKEIPIAVVQHGAVVPLGVMVRGTMEWLLDKPMLETLFQRHAPDQYYLGRKEPHSRTSGVLDRGMLKEVADVVRQVEQPVHV